MKWLVMLLCFCYSAAWAVWNHPHLADHQSVVRYSAFSSPPKTLDPAKAYSSNEYAILAQIYEPLLQYHYLKRPYQLIPLTAASLPSVQTIRTASGDETIYTLAIQPGIFYQPHPAFVKNQHGQLLYRHLTADQLQTIHNISDFKQVATRELVSDDYIYQIKRLASPYVHSPILSLMSEYVVGLSELSQQLMRQYKKRPRFLDLRRYPLAGVKRVDRYHLQIRIKGHYPQFRYWLAMPFFSPMPWEADQFYAQKGLLDKNISLATYPVGTGPYMMVENDPNRVMVLEKNPKFHQEHYPSRGEVTDESRGLLALAGQKLPFIDRLVLTLDKESIPRWHKFLQGYYDSAGIGPESFEQAVHLDRQGQPVLSQALAQKGLRLSTTVIPSLFYLGFNMKDPVVGGYQAQHIALRQAIAIAMDYREYVAIFLNGRGILAQSPIPPGIFGHPAKKTALNPVVYQWQAGHLQQRPLQEAKALLKKAGYPGGVDPQTGQALVLHFDIMGSGSPDEQAYFNWMRKQFHKLGIALQIRATHYNRFQDKMRKGAAQIFAWGWHADYPDPENFLFLFYGPNGKVEHGGENAMNYKNPQFDRWFEAMRVLPNGAKRQHLIDKMVRLLQQDSPVVLGYYPVQFTLSHQWNAPTKPHGIAQNTLKYQHIDQARRAQLQRKWNAPVLWPLLWLALAILVLLLPLWLGYWRRQNKPNIKRMDEKL